MKVLLTKEVESVGHAGQVVNVADGFARNYLFPRNLAIPANKGTLKNLERIAEEARKREERHRTDAEAMAKKITENPITIRAHAGHDTSKLFGSVTAQDIADALKEQLGIEVDKRRIEITEPIRSLGEYDVPVKLHTKVLAHIRLNVVPLTAEEQP
ncbi:MAG: 50S ribosomal protein L9 [Armatimonadota bacterium]